VVYCWNYFGAGVELPKKASRKDHYNYFRVEITAMNDSKASNVYSVSPNFAIGSWY
jgi:hypothetical protein